MTIGRATPCRNPAFQIQKIYVKDLSSSCRTRRRCSPSRRSRRWRCRSAPRRPVRRGAIRGHRHGDRHRAGQGQGAVPRRGEAGRHLRDPQRAAAEELERSSASPARSIVYPYLRAIVSDVVRGGFPPVLLAPVNFQAHVHARQQRSRPPAAMPAARRSKSRGEPARGAAEHEPSRCSAPAPGARRLRRRAARHDVRCGRAIRRRPPPSPARGATRATSRLALPAACASAPNSPPSVGRTPCGAACCSSRRRWPACATCCAGSRRTSPLRLAVQGLRGRQRRCSPHQVARRVARAEARCGALSGPSFALEVARGLPTALTLASKRRALRARGRGAAPRRRAAHLLQRPTCVGVEVGGAVKNVLAIATGIVRRARRSA